MNPTTRRVIFYLLAIVIAMAALAIDLTRLAIHCYRYRHDPLLRQCQPVPVREIVSAAAAEAVEAIAPYVQPISPAVKATARVVLPYLEWVRTVILRAHYSAMGIEPSYLTDPDVYWA